MPYYRGRDVEVFWSTEDSDFGISASGVSDLAAGSWSSGSSLLSHFIVPPMKTDSEWDGTETDAVGAFPARASAVMDLMSLDIVPSKEREDIDFRGRVVHDHITVRKVMEATITKKMDSNAYALVSDTADAGVTGSGGGQDLNQALDQTTTNSGYRLYIKISPTTGSDELWVTGRNLTLVDHKIVPGAAKTTEEQITFKGNIWDKKAVPNITATVETEL